jgi:hypothetical protein
VAVAFGKRKQMLRRMLKLTKPALHRYALVLASATFLAFATNARATKESDDDDHVERLKRGTSETLSAAGAIASETKEQAEKRLKKELNRLGTNVDELKAKAAHAGAAAKARMQAQIPDLTAKRDELEKKLEDLKTRSGAAWDEMATGTESALHELRKSYEKAKSHFD